MFGTKLRSDDHVFPAFGVAPMLGKLDFEDVVRIVHLIAEATDPARGMSAHERRIAIAQSLSDAIEADLWNWVTGSFDSNRTGDGAVTSSLDGGFRDENERADFFRISLDPVLVAVVQEPFRHALQANVAMTRSRAHILPDDEWPHTALAAAYNSAGFEDFILSGCPLRSLGHSAIGFHRRLGRPHFTPREEAIVHAVFPQISWLHANEVPTETRAAVNLSPRERQVTKFLLDGDSKKQITHKLGISPHTVEDYVKAIYRKLNVSSRGELLAKVLRREME